MERNLIVSPEVVITTLEDGHVLAETALDLANEEGAVSEAVIVSMAQAACKEGIGLDGANGQTSRIIDMRIDFFENGEGDHLYADSQRIHDDGLISVWRTSVSRGAKRRSTAARKLIAETSQTIRRYPPDGASPAPATSETIAEEAPPVRRGRGRPRRDETQSSSVSEQRRRQIFEGASEVITRKGYGNATIREIARAAKISIPTMYQHISSKEDILFMITSECMQEIFQSFKESLSSGVSAQKKMEHAITEYVKYISKNRRYINLVYRETKSLNKEGREKIFGIEREFCALWETIIQAGNESGEFDVSDPELAANMIYFFCNVWALRHWNLGQYTEDEVAEWLIRFIISGLRSPLHARAVKRGKRA